MTIDDRSDRPAPPGPPPTDPKPVPATDPPAAPVTGPAPARATDPAAVPATDPAAARATDPPDDPAAGTAAASAAGTSAPDDPTVAELLGQLGALHHLAVRAEQLARHLGVHGGREVLDDVDLSALEQARDNASAIVASLQRAV